MASKQSGVPLNLTELLQDTFLETDRVDSVKTCLIALNPSLIPGPEGQKPPKLDAKKAKKLLSLAFQFALAGSIESEIETELKSNEVASSVFIGFTDLILCATRTRVADKPFTEDIKLMGFPQEIQSELITTFIAQRASLEASARSHRNRLPCLTKLDWRIDVAISSTQLNRVFRPTILFQTTLDDGTIRTFECSLERFHKLRYNVARMVATMQNIEQHPTLTRFAD